MSNSETLISPKLNGDERAELAQIEEEISDIKRPEKRSDCANVPRPCPFISCKYNLYLEVNPVTGAIKINFPEKEIEEMRYSCSLDLAEKDSTLEEIGSAVHVTRERVRQIEFKALNKLRRKIELLPIKQELLQYFADIGRFEERTKDLILHDPNPTRLTWDEWRLRFIPQKPKEITVHEHTQMLRRRLPQTSKERLVDVPGGLGAGEQEDTARGLHGLGAMEGESKRGIDQDISRSDQQSEGGSSNEEGELLLNDRRHPGDLGELSILPNNPLPTESIPSVSQTDPEPEPSHPPTEDKTLVADISSSGVEGLPARGTPRKERMPAVLNSNLGRLSYALRSCDEEQLLAVAVDLRSSPYQTELQDRLRTYIADSCARGKHKDLFRAQQFLAVLLGKEPKRKDSTMKPEQALNLLELLSARPDKADLIETLAIEAGLFAPKSTPTSSAVFDRDISAEELIEAKEHGRGKRAKPNEKGESQFLSGEHKLHINSLLKSGWSQNAISTAVGCPVSSFSEARKDKMRMKKTFITKLLKLQPRQQAEAAE